HSDTHQGSLHRACYKISVRSFAVRVLMFAAIAAISPAHLASAAPPAATSASSNPAPIEVRLPPGTRTNADGQLVSTRGLRDTTDVIAKDLARRGIAARQIGPYRVRGVELTRFLSETASTS